MREELTGLRKAAIVLLSLGQRERAAVLRLMSPEAARHARQEMRRVGALRRVSLRTRQLVLGQFCAAASPYPPLPEPAPSASLQPEQRPRTGPFASLRGAGTRDLLNTIGDEHPQTIALVLAHLSPNQASEVLAGLDQNRRVEVVKRIAGIEQTSARVIEQVEQSLRQRLAGIMGGTIRSGGVSAVAEILNSGDHRLEDQILSELDADAPDLAEQIRRVAAVFENLLLAPDEDIQAVVEQLDPATISLALRTAGDELKRKVLWNLPQGQAEQIERDLSSMHPVAVREIERAQQRVAEVVHRLESAGEIEALGRGRRRVGRSGSSGGSSGGSGGSGGAAARRDWRGPHRKAV